MPEINANVAVRCPVCFEREKDIVLHKRGDESFYCTKCSYTGSREEVFEYYHNLKVKYKYLTRRMTIEGLKNM